MSCHHPSRSYVLMVPILLMSLLVGAEAAQAFQQAPDSTRAALAASPATDESSRKQPNPLGSAGRLLIRPYQPQAASSSGGMSSGLLGGVPNVKFGYVQYFGPNVRQGRSSLDYLLPIDVGHQATIFGEAHGEFQDDWRTGLGGEAGRRADLSLGGGYRRLLGENVLLGINGFFDATRFADKWHSSGGGGSEMAFALPGDTLIDLHFNYYGSMFNGDTFVNTFRAGPGNFDIEMGYSVPILDNLLDLRMKAAAYQFETDGKVRGWRAGIDFTSSCGVFNAKYEAGSDQLSGPYHSAGGYITLAFQLEELFSGQTPFSKPQPVLESSRNMRRYLHTDTKRSWYQPTPKDLN